MSEFSEDRKARYLDTMLSPGERVYFVRLTGHMMVKSRTKLFVALAKKVWEMVDKKEPWELFRFGIERDPDNKYDSNAVSIFMWRKSPKTGEWDKHQLGFIPQSEKGKGKVYHQKAFSQWLEDDLISKVNYTVEKGSEETFESPLVRLVHIYWNADRGFGSAHFAIHTPYEVQELPRGTKDLETFGIPPDGEEIEGEEGEEDEAPPSTETSDFPDTKTIDKLISAHKEFLDLFSYEDSEGECNPCWFLQASEPRHYKNDSQFEEDWEDGHDSTWGFAETVENLKKIQSEFGPTMAQNYYRFTGIYEGPFNQHHASKVLANVNEILAVARRMRA